MRRIQQNELILAVILIITFLVGLGWVNFQFAKNNPGGNDFLAHYVGTRALIFEGLSPYSDQVAEEIQTVVFGRPAQEGEIEHRVVYPLFSALIFAPFALIKDYTIARVAWMTFLEISLLLSAYITLELFAWKPKIGILGFYYLFSLLWYHAFRGVINGNAVILINLLLTGTMFAIKKGNDRVTGILLAFSTFKPNLVVLVIIFVLIWSVYQRRTQIIIWFLGTLVALTLGGMLIIPDWILQNIWEILKYPAYNPAGTLGAVLGNWFPGIKTTIKLVIGVSLGLILGYEWWIARKQNFEWFLWTICFTLVVSQWIGIQTDPGNFIILFTPFVMILVSWDDRWKKHGTTIIISILSIALVGLWAIFVVTLDFDYQPMQNSIMFIPFPGIVLIGLYWIKWWVKGPNQLLWKDIS